MTILGKYISNEAMNMRRIWESENCIEKNNKIRCEGDDFKLEFFNYNGNDAWCASFVSTVMVNVGRELGYKTKLKLSASTSVMRSSGENYFKVDKNPAVGSIFHRKYDDAYSISVAGRIGTGHVGIVVNYDNNYIYTIEGNKGDKVQAVRYKINDFFDGVKGKYSKGHYIIHVEEELNVNKDVELQNVLAFSQDWGQGAKSDDDDYNIAKDINTKSINKKSYYLRKLLA